MKKSSAFYSSMTIACFIITQAGATLFLWCLLSFYKDMDRFDICISILFVFLAELSFACIWLSTRFSRYTYEFDAEKVTVKRGKRITQISWDDCEEVGLVTSPINQVEQLVFAYATTVPLSAKEKSKFLASRKNDWEHTAFFECDDETIQRLMQVLPKQFADAIQVDWWRIEGWFNSKQ